MRVQLFQDTMLRRHLTENETDFSNEIFLARNFDLQEKFEKKEGDAK